MRQAIVLALLGGLPVPPLVAAQLPEGAGFVSSLGMRFVRIEPGRFEMGHGGPLPDPILDATELDSDRPSGCRSGATSTSARSIP